MQIPYLMSGIFKEAERWMEHAAGDRTIRRYLHLVHNSVAVAAPDAPRSECASLRALIDHHYHHHRVKKTLSGGRESDRDPRGKEKNIAAVGFQRDSATPSLRSFPRERIVFARSYTMRRIIS